MEGFIFFLLLPLADGTVEPRAAALAGVDLHADPPLCDVPSPLLALLDDACKFYWQALDFCHQETHASRQSGLLSANIMIAGLILKSVVDGGLARLLSASTNAQCKQQNDALRRAYVPKQ